MRFSLFLVATLFLASLSTIDAASEAPNISNVLAGVYDQPLNNIRIGMLVNAEKITPTQRGQLEAIVKTNEKITVGAALNRIGVTESGFGTSGGGGTSPPNQASSVIPPPSRKDVVAPPHRRDGGSVAPPPRRGGSVVAPPPGRITSSVGSKPVNPTIERQKSVKVVQQVMISVKGGAPVVVTLHTGADHHWGYLGVKGALKAYTFHYNPEHNLLYVYGGLAPKDHMQYKFAVFRNGKKAMVVKFNGHTDPALTLDQSNPRSMEIINDASKVVGAFNVPQEREPLQLDPKSMSGDTMYAALGMIVFSQLEREQVE